MCGTVAWINWEGGDICVQIQDYIVASTLPLHAVPQNVCTVLSFVRLTTVSCNSTTENMEMVFNTTKHCIKTVPFSLFI